MRRSRVVLLAIVLAAAGLTTALVVLLRPQAPAPPQRPQLLIGVDDDTVKWVSQPDDLLRDYRRLGIGAVRVWIPWQGETTPTGVTATYLARAEGLAARHIRVVLAVFGFARDAPLTAPARSRFCDFARQALASVPDVRDVVVWNEANGPDYWPRTAGATAYERLLARCWDALHAERPDVNVLDSTASHHDPARFLRELGAAYRSSNRTRPLVDTFGHNPYPNDSRESPEAHHTDGTLAEGDYGRLIETLRTAFAGTAQPLPGEGHTTVWYLEDGFQSVVPAAKHRFYTGSENETEPLSARGQAERLSQAVRLAACQPAVGAFFNFELMDESRLAGWQSGVLWRDGSRKAAFVAFRQAIGDIRSGSASCPAGSQSS